MDWPRKLQATILPPTWLHVSHVCEHRQMNIHSILNRRTMVHWRANDVRIARRSTQTDQVQYMLACTYIQAGVHTYRPIAHAGMHIHPLESHFTSCPHEVHTGAHIHGRMHTHTQTYTCIAYVHTYKTHTNKEGIPQCITYIHIHAIQYTHTSYMRYNILTYIQTITHTIQTTLY